MFNDDYKLLGQKTGCIPNTIKYKPNITKYHIGKENRVHQMNIYLVTNYMFVDDITREIVKFESDWEVVE